MLFNLLIWLQAAQVSFLWFHDWVPLGPLNDPAEARAADGWRRLLWITLIQSVPYTIGLVFSVIDLPTGFPVWLWYWLWISYGLLFAGELRAWWIPWWRGTDAARVARYGAMFGTTHAFLPERHGIVPNTLHVALHLCTAATLLTLVGLAM